MHIWPCDLRFIASKCGHIVKLSIYISASGCNEHLYIWHIAATSQSIHKLFPPLYKCQCHYNKLLTKLCYAKIGNDIWNWKSIVITEVIINTGNLKSLLVNHYLIIGQTCKGFFLMTDIYNNVPQNKMQ